MNRSAATESINKLDPPDRDTLTEPIEAWNKAVAARLAQSGTGQFSPQEVTYLNSAWDRIYDVAANKALARKGC